LFDQWAFRHDLLDKIVGVKYFNVFGPNEYHKDEMRSVVLKAFEQIRSSDKMRLFKSYRNEYKDGEQVRDFIYVKDAVEMTLFFLENKKIGGLFNIGSGVANTWNKLAGSIFNALDRKLKVEYIDMPETIREKYQYFTCADISKIKKAGYTKPMTSLEDAVSDYVRNYLVNGKRFGE
ncbi:MAG: NAD-dependent epimerase/dehydratase family protein, partial [Candidatus Kryptoniota bacterium]